MNQATIIFIGLNCLSCTSRTLDFVGIDDSEPGDSYEEGNEAELTLEAKKSSGIHSCIID